MMSNYPVLGLWCRTVLVTENSKDKYVFKETQLPTGGDSKKAGGDMSRPAIFIKRGPVLKTV